MYVAGLKIIGINPYVEVPEGLLDQIFQDWGKDKGPIPVKGKVNGKEFVQTLVRYKGEWRLYINHKMLAHSPKRIGEKLEISLTVDHDNRTVQPFEPWLEFLNLYPEDLEKFYRLPPSLQKEFYKYFQSLKTPASVQKNLQKALDFLQGRGAWLGRKSLPK